MGGTTIGSARPVQQTLRCDATEVHADLWRRNNGRVAPWRRRTCEADQAAPQDDWLSVKQIPELCIEAGHPLSPTGLRSSAVRSAAAKNFRRRQAEPDTCVQLLCSRTVNVGPPQGKTTMQVLARSCRCSRNFRLASPVRITCWRCWRVCCAIAQLRF